MRAILPTILYLLTLASGELRQLTFDQTVISDIQWDYDGRSLYFNSKRKDHNRLWRIGVGGGEPIPTVVSLPNINSFAIAPNGKLLAATQPITDTLIDIFKLGGRVLNPLRPVCKINSSRADDTPGFHPMGHESSSSPPDPGTMRSGSPMRTAPTRPS